MEPPLPTHRPPHALGRRGRRPLRRTSLVAVAILAAAAMGTVPSSAGAAYPGQVTLTSGGSVDCASGTSTVELTFAYVLSSDITSVEIDGGTATFEGSSEG